MNVSFGIIGQTQQWAWPRECPQCHASDVQFEKIADGWYAGEVPPKNVPSQQVSLTSVCLECITKQTRIAQLEEELSDWKTGKCRCHPWEGVHTTDCPASAKQLNEFLKQAKADVILYRDKAVEYEDKYQRELVSHSRTHAELEKAQDEIEQLREASNIITGLPEKRT